ncbi:P-loop containing nucleoside triphosphate hydrolase protein [Mycena sp. CBHHK59/15]|nr:P-loop containing nucleoside triphosphate hydrolase protein [Mycena sp. CBHHK59/15]
MNSNPRFCYNFVEAGCNHQGCRLRHDIRKCTCGLVVPLQHFDTHQAGKRHRGLLDSKLKEERRGNLPSHPRPSPAAGNPGPSRAATEVSHCDRCGKEIPSVHLAAHVDQHRRRQLFADAQAVSEEAEEDKNGITVSHKEGIDFGVVGTENPVYIDLTVLKTEDRSRVILTKFSIRKNENGTKFSVSLAGKSKWVRHNEARTIAVKFFPSFDGEYEDVLELLFLDVGTKRRFLITRKIRAVVGSQEDYDQLKPKSAYSRRKPAPFQFNGPIIRSLRPPTWGPIQWVGRLQEYKPPDDLIRVAFGSQAGPNSRAIMAGVRQFLPPSFTPNTYGKHFQVMLYIEDEQMKQDLDMYAMNDVELKPNYPRYDLQVKGLEEGRPSVIVGDFILVKRTGEAEGPWYEGRVHQVHSNHVSLRFDEDQFSTYKGSKFDVRFTLNRLPHRRMHQALTNSFKESRILFPRAEHLSGNRPLTHAQCGSITPINRLIGEDPEQFETVAAIVHQPKGSVPFVVFGPPGTGKTVTIVEAIRQLLLRDPDARILACAPSNSAADLIARNLASIGTTELFRLNALANDNLTFVLPVVEDLRKFRVVVSTCLSGGVPANLGVKRGHFSHIFIDEAGQATEPEAILPIKSIAGKSTNIVLAGDNKQLGPIVHSWIASSLGLKVSYLYRIMQRDIYSLEPETTFGGSGITIVKLVNNFRSHPAILEFSNQQPCGNPALIRSLENSNELPTKKFPLIFHGVIGKDDREGSSPSFFNIAEATLVKKYVAALVSDRKQRVRPEEIGVITPYHAQRWKIVNLLEKDPKLRGVTVGSVEEFQGQERRVIIMSTVRSNTNYVEADIKRTLGFVANPQRFNVAITRAQALLVVIGNPDILALDPLWRAFLNYIYTRGGWRGKEIAWNPEDPVGPGAYDGEMRRRAEGEAEEMMARLKALITQRNEGSDYDFDISDSDLELGLDRGMRRDAE